MAALAVVLLVPLTVGWLVERLAYGEARATDAVVAPLRAVVPQGAATVKMAGMQPGEAMPQPVPVAVEATSEPEASEASAAVAASPKR